MTALIKDRDLLDLSKNNAVLRLWLPESGITALDEIVKRTGIVASKYLREFFVVYLYGMHELLKMQATEKGLYYRPPLESLTDDFSFNPSKREVMFSRAPSVECIPGLGKNIFPFKVFLPQRIKDDLQLLADEAGMPLSQFVREILISHFFGHTFWPEKLKAWSDDQEIIGVEWEQGLREGKTISYSAEAPKESDGNNVVQLI